MALPKAPATDSTPVVAPVSAEDAEAIREEMRKEQEQLSFFMHRNEDETNESSTVAKPPVL